MSFGDISKGWNSNTSTSNVPSIQNSDEISQLSTSLQNLQKECISLKDMITSMRRRKVGPSEKHELDLKLKQIKDTESKLKNQLDLQSSKIDSLSRSEAITSKRATLSKLLKDFDKIKTNIQSLANESTLIKVVNERGETESVFQRVSTSSSSTKVDTTHNSNQYSSNKEYDNQNYNSISKNNNQIQQQQQQQQIVLKPLLSGREVDEAIMEERERDIKKMNHDLLLVNEMFKDMAQLVDNQGTKINEISTATDKSHERAKAGLQQVNQAAEYQPVCIIC